MAGRVVFAQAGLKASARPKVCSGCGTEVVRSSGGAPLLGGASALDVSRASQKHKGRWADVTESTGFVCDRCKQLQAGNVWAAYDAMQDLEAGLFRQQLKSIITRRKFGVCVKVVDGLDFEGSIIPSMRNIVGSVPVLLVVNKVLLFTDSPLHPTPMPLAMLFTS